MAKKRKTIYAGRVVYDVVYTVASPRDPQEIRREKKKISSAAQARTNCNTATRKLELLMAANFEPSDLVVTFTYDPEHLPDSYPAGQKLWSKFIRQLRKYRAARGQKLAYIYVNEGKHGDHRLHHHLIINATQDDLDTMRSLWIYGEQIDLSYIRQRGYEGWARYLSKERREASLNGKRMYTASRNLKKPEVEYAWVDDATTIEAPPGAMDVIESGDRNAFASYKYVKYTMPTAAYLQKQKKDSSFFADLKYTVTSRPPCRKKKKPIDRRQECRV